MGDWSLSLQDWELTLKELKSQRVQMTLSLAVVEAGIERIEKLLEGRR